MAISEMNYIENGLILTPLIPKATEDTNNMIASSVYSGTAAAGGKKWNAFDDDLSTAWLGANYDVLEYIGYKFDNDVKIKAFEYGYDTSLSSTYNVWRLWIFEYSIDGGTNWLRPKDNQDSVDVFWQNQHVYDGKTGIVLFNEPFIANAIRAKVGNRYDDQSAPALNRLAKLQVYS